jgi:NADP-dependent 3-hydroxy acid dehydrogenase YdfG
MAKDPVPISGRVVAITGGARGIGRATAVALAARGARVAIGDLDVELAERTAAELGGGAVALALDVTDRESFAEFLAGAERELGPLDVLVNNAGIMPAGPFLQESDETARRQVDINVHGVILGMKLALPGMVARGRGHVVNLASMAGKSGIPGIATYCGTKHAVIGISEAVRGELRGSGIELTVVMPAFVNTELISGAATPRGVKVAEPEEVAEEIAAVLERPRFDAYVPKSAGRIGRVTALLPRAAREAVGRALHVDRILVDIDRDKRAAYEARTTGSTASDRESEETRA